MDLTSDRDPKTGANRLAAAKTPGREKIHADVVEGGKRDAILFSVGARAADGQAVADGSDQPDITPLDRRAVGAIAMTSRRRLRLGRCTHSSADALVEILDATTPRNGTQRRHVKSTCLDFWNSRHLPSQRSDRAA